MNSLFFFVNTLYGGRIYCQEWLPLRGGLAGTGVSSFLYFQIFYTEPVLLIAFFPAHIISIIRIKYASPWSAAPRVWLRASSGDRTAVEGLGEGL